MFYRLISYCIHKCIHIFFIVQILYKDFQRFVKRWFNSDRSVSIENSSQVRLKKLPSHLGIIINEDHIAINDIASIINWCLCHGIYHVSIYDEHGEKCLFIWLFFPHIYFSNNSIQSVGLKFKYFKTKGEF